MLDALRHAALVGAVLGLGGCSLWSGSSGYQMDASAQQLQVPPQLSAPKAQSTFAIPPAQAGGTQVASAPGVASAAAGVATATSQPGVLPSVPNMKLREAGGFRWLQVATNPGKVWPKAVAFFKSRGFTLAEANPHTGVIRTDWKISKHGLPKGFLASLIKNLMYSGERERYTARLVRGAHDSTDVYLSYQGAIKAKDSQGDMVWQWQPPNPGKEASTLQALMVYMGAPKGEATQLAGAVSTAPHAVYALGKHDGTTVLNGQLPFDQAWPQIGLALDRVDLVVDQQSRAQRVYEVSYVGASQSNALQRLFGGGSVLNHGAKFRITVAASSGGSVTVHALNAKGKPLSPNGAHAVLSLLLSGLQ